MNIQPPSFLGKTQPAPTNVAAEAKRGLEEADALHLAFWRVNRERNTAVDASLDRVDTAASSQHDAGAAQTVALARAAAAPLASDPKARLRALKVSLHALETGAAGGVAPLAALALAMSAALPADRAPLLRGPVQRAAVDSITGTARAATLSEAPFADFVGHLTTAGVDPAAALDALSKPAPTTVEGLADTARRLQGRSDRSATVIATALRDLDGAAKRDNDARALAHLNRAEAWRQLAPGSAQRLDALTLDALAGGAPAGAETAPALAARLVENAQKDEAGRLATAALDEAGAGTPALAGWQALRGELASLGLPPEAKAAADLTILKLAAKDVAPTFETQVAALAAAAARTVDPTVARAVLAAAERHDATQARSAEFTRWRGLADKLASPALQSRAIAKALTLAAAPQAPAMNEFFAFGASALEGCKTLDERQKLTAAVLESSAEAAHADKNDALQAWLASMSKAVGVPQAEEKYNQSLISTLLGTKAAPTGIRDYAAASSRILQTAGYNLDRIHLAPLVTDGLTASDAGEQVKLAFLGDVARLRDLQDMKTIPNAVTASLGALSKPANIQGSELASFVYTTAAAAPGYVDALQIARVGLDRMQATADPDLADALSFVARVCDVAASDEQYRWKAVGTALQHLAGKPVPNQDPLLALMLKVLGTTENGQRVGVAAAAGEVLLARGQRVASLDLQAQGRFLRDLAGMEFSNHDSHAAAVYKAAETITKRTGPQEQGLATIALDITTVAKTFRDDFHVLDAVLDVALASAKSALNGERSAFLQTLVDASAVENYEDKYRFAVEKVAVKAIADHVDADPGNLAKIGLGMVNASYYWQTMLAVGNVVLEGLEKMAASENDKMFTPVLVADTRQKMAAAPSPKAQVEALRKGLEELSKLTGDGFRKALINALQGEQSGDAPKVENGDDFVTIGGIKVPKK